MRLFVAVHFTNNVVDALLRAQDTLRRQGRGNFTRPENLHLTLAFIGETARWQDAAQAVEQIEAPPFPITLKGIGRFGDLYWAGVQPSVQLTSLQQQVKLALEAQGFPLEDRPFQPHLTLCRQFRPQAALSIEEAEHALGQPSCLIRRVSLMESTHVSGKRVYSERCGRKLH